MAVPDSLPLTHSWPKWWSKFEIYGTEFDGPALVVDLDTAFLDELKILPEHENQAIFLRDPWRDGSRNPERLGGGFSYLPKWARLRLWNMFCEQKIKPEGDDQPFLHSVFGDIALRWQDHYLDQVMSYKAHVKWLGLTDETKVVFWHGQPRPWNPDLTEPWIPRFNSETKQPSENV